MQHSHAHTRDDHDHDHGHDHHGRAHGHGHSVNERSVGVAALLTGGFMVAEIAGGLFSGSLALLADAGHMLTDFASLALAWLGFRLTRRPADWRRTYGFDRFAVLVAFVNGISLFAIAVWIVVEAVQRLNSPVAVLGAPMLWIAAAGLAVNVLSFFVLRSGDKDNLNIRAAVLHVIGDLLGSVAAVIAALVILATGWTPIDPLLSIVVALIVIRSAWRVVADSGHILLEGSPPGVDSRTLRDHLRSTLPFVLDIHHVHAWSISQERPMVTLHASIAASTDSAVAVREIKRQLALHFRITHATIEIEYDACGDEPSSAC
ncbi:MAG TPA: cation diffusion facilitator family transporter [Gammaproteobacteria bacterium]|nr:cation diffusion facilitator family transporter [Gammaproteobacteria bacterium]